MKTSIKISLTISLILIVSIAFHFLYNLNKDAEFRLELFTQFCQNKGYPNLVGYRYDKLVDEMFVRCKELTEDGIWKYSVWIQWK